MTEQNGAKELWKNFEEERYTTDEAVSNLYVDILEKCIKCMQNYEAIFKNEYSLEKKYFSDTEKIIAQLSDKLKERGLIFEIQETGEAGCEKILVTVYLLQKTEEQYQEMQKLKKERSKSFNQGESIVYGLITIAMIIIFTSMMCIGFMTESLFIIISTIILIIATGFIMCKNEYDSYTKLDEYAKKQEKVFCDENTDIHRIDELEEKYL